MSIELVKIRNILENMENQIILHLKSGNTYKKIDKYDKILKNIFKFLINNINKQSYNNLIDYYINNFNNDLKNSIIILNLIIQRIKHGIDVAKIKLKSPNLNEVYNKYLLDENYIYTFLTNKEVEDKILKRLENKTISISNKFSQNVINLYKNYIIPLTKEIEFIYIKNYFITYLK